MHLGLLAASVILGSFEQPRLSETHPPVPVKRMYQWFVVPGGGVGPMPTPFLIMVPLSKADAAKYAKSSKLRQELHIVIETDSAEKTQTLTNALIEKVRQVVSGVTVFSDQSDEQPVAPGANCKSWNDPRQVIDPVVTGF